MKWFNSISPMWRVPIKFGLVGAILSIILMIALYSTGRHPLVLPPYLDSRIIIFLIFIYFAVREFKEIYNEGYLHLWQGLLVGSVVYVTVGLVGAVFIVLYTNYDANFLSLYIDLTADGMEAAKAELVFGDQKVKMSEEEFMNHLASLKTTTAINLAVDYFIKSCIIGFFVPLLYSVFFRKVPN